MELTRGIKKLGAFLEEARKQRNMSREQFGHWLTERMEERYPDQQIVVREAALSTIEAGHYTQQVNLAVVLAIVESGFISGLDYNAIFEVILTGETPGQEESVSEPDRYPEAIEEIREGSRKMVGKGLSDSELLTWLNKQAGIPKNRLKMILDGYRPEYADVVALAKAIATTSAKMLALYGYETRTKVKRAALEAPRLQRI